MPEHRQSNRNSGWARLAEVFTKHHVDYLIIGKSGAIIQGFPDTTQDIDIFPRTSTENGRRIVAALQELGFLLDDTLRAAIVAGKDFVQIRGGPVDVDLVFAPDGIESFDAAKAKCQLIERIYPVASIDDIIESKRRAARQKDKEALDRLRDFAKYLRGR